MFGNRAIYHDGWVACTRHSIPWLMVPNPPLSDDVWELYNVNEDFSEADNLAAKNPEKLKELQKLFNEEAAKNHVFPIDDRRAERFDAGTAGRPDLMGKRTSLTVYEGMIGIMENAFINVKNQSKTITADVDIPSKSANGVILAQGGRFGGWSLYVKDGRPAYTYNFVGLHEKGLGVYRRALTGPQRRRINALPTGRRLVMCQQDTGQQAGNGLDDREHRHLAAVHHEIAEGDLADSRSGTQVVDPREDVGVAGEVGIVAHRGSLPGHRADR